MADDPSKGAGPTRRSVITTAAGAAGVSVVLPYLGGPARALQIVTAIVELRNASNCYAIVTNWETPSDTNKGKGEVAAGTEKSIKIWVPWCSSKSTDFSKHRLTVDLYRYKGGPRVRRFTIWQSDINGEDRVRVSTDGRWHNPGDVIGGVAAAGVSESLVYWLGDRSLVINDFSLWLLPIELVKALKNANGLLAAEGVQICDERTRTLDPVPLDTKASVTAFSMAGPPSDAFDKRRANARFLYRDSGKRYEFTLTNGKVTVQPQVMTPSFATPGRRVPALTEAVSYNTSRGGESIPLPEFDMIAANGGRVFAKEKGTDRFFFAIIDEMFIHKGATESLEHAIPSTYFKLDPEFNKPSANIQDIIAHLDLKMGGASEKRPSHPATARWPFYRVALKFGATPAFSVTVRRGVWHLIDTRPPDRRLAPDGAPKMAIATQLLSLPHTPLALGILTGVFGAGAVIVFTILMILQLKEQAEIAFNHDPPAGVPKYDHVAYCSTPQPAPVWRSSIDFARVLDVGVGHMHHHQQYDGAAGGEVRILTAELTPEYPDNMYQVFNGPVDDADGYNDGTCNFYLLVRLRNGSYALLYLDEQSFFSSRWRIADPDDYKGSYGANLTATLATKPNLHPAWARANYWSPFQYGLIGEESRMAVSAQVVLVTGDFPPWAEYPPLIYSTNFSFGTMDRTWRWRPLPPAGARRGNPATLTDVDTAVYPQSIRLRDDLTIHLKGTLTGVGPGRWWQRYLPTSNKLVPPNATGARPSVGYTHAWKFMSERVFQLADRFSHFGVYDQVDTRTRYYPVQTPSAQVAQALSDVAATTILDPATWWSADASQLWVDAYTFRIDTLESPWPPWPPYKKRPMSPSSLFNHTMYLKIVRRGSRWIAMVRDKRDDDMVGFSALPKTVKLKTISPSRSVSIQLNPAVAMPEGPAVEFAYFWWDTPTTAAIAFSPPRNNQRVGENVWRVRMAAFDANGAVVHMLNVTTEGRFALNPATGTHDYRWTPTAAGKQQLLTYASEQGSFVHGTSIWFEDLTGHVATPDQIHWVKPAAGDRTLQLAVTGPDAQVWLQAIGKTDGRPVGGYVLAGSRQVKAAEPGPYIGSAGVRQIFVIGADDRVYFLKVDAAGKPVSGYIPLATTAAKAISVGYYPMSRGPQFSSNKFPLLFIIGNDDQVYFHKFDQALNPVGGYVPLPGPVKMKTILARGALPQLITVGMPDDLVYVHNFEYGNPAGSYTQAPNAVKAISSTKSYPDLFVIGTDDQVYRRMFNYEGVPLGSDVLTYPMKVKALSAGWPNTYVIGTDDQVYYRNLFSGNPFTGIPGKVKAIHAGNDELASRELLFVIGTDDQVYIQRFDRSGQNILISGYPHYIPVPNPVIAINGLSPLES